MNYALPVERLISNLFNLCFRVSQVSSNSLEYFLEALISSISSRRALPSPEPVTPSLVLGKTGLDGPSQLSPLDTSGARWADSEGPGGGFLLGTMSSTISPLVSSARAFSTFKIHAWVNSVKAQEIRFTKIYLWEIQILSQKWRDFLLSEPIEFYKWILS